MSVAIAIAVAIVVVLLQQWFLQGVCVIAASPLGVVAIDASPAQEIEQRQEACQAQRHTCGCIGDSKVHHPEVHLMQQGKAPLKKGTCIKSG